MLNAHGAQIKKEAGMEHSATLYDAATLRTLEPHPAAAPPDSPLEPSCSPEYGSAPDHGAARADQRSRSRSVPETQPLQRDRYRTVK